MTKCSTLKDCAVQAAHYHTIGMVAGLRMAAHGARYAIKTHNLTGVAAKNFEELAQALECTIKKIESGE